MTIARRLRSAFARHPAPVARPAARWLGVESLEARENPSGGLLDPTFGSGGQLAASFSGYRDSANAVAAQADGKIVVAGTTTASKSHTGSDFLVARYNADGTLDTAFGTGGHTATDLGSSNDGASAVALLPQADGTNKILVAGGTTTSSGAGEVALARYTAGGALDTTFGSKGKVVTNLGGNATTASVTVDGSGRIVVAAIGQISTGATTAFLARYTATGALDTTFGSKGVVTVSVPLLNEGARAVIALQPDGRIVLAGTMLVPNDGREFVTARYTATGAVDTSFGTGGTIATHVGVNDGLGGLTIDGSGRVLVAGWDTGPTPYAHNFDLLRYTPGGLPDGTFGSGGLVTPTYPGTPPAGLWIVSGRTVAGVAVQADGDIVVAGQLYDGQVRHVVATRVDTNGNPDTGYGTGGWAAGPFNPLGWPSGQVNAMALQPDGRLLVAGYADPGTSPYPYDLVLTRFVGSTSSAVQLGSFAAASNPVAAGGTESLTAGPITDSNTGATVTAVAFYAVAGNGTEQFLGYGTENADGTWTLTFTVNLASGSYTLPALAVDSTGAVGDPLSLSLQVV